MKKAYYIRFLIALVILFLIVTGFLGIAYPIGFLNIQFVPLIEKNLFNFSILSISLLLSIVVLTCLFGRLYCSLLCPLGTLQEIFSLIFNKKGHYIKNYPYKYFLSAVCFGVLVGGSVLIIKYFDPYTIFGSSVTLTLFNIIVLFLILALVFYKNRFFCSNICPTGTILGLLSKFSLFKLRFMLFV